MTTSTNKQAFPGGLVPRGPTPKLGCARLEEGLFTRRTHNELAR